MKGLIGIAGLGSAALLLLSPPTMASPEALSSQRAQLALSHLPNVLGELAPLRDTDTAQTINIEFALKPRNADEIQPLLDGIYNPSSASYGHYLTQAEYRSQFSPTQADVDAVVSYAKSEGLNVTGVSLSKMLVHASGTAAQMNNAFGVTLRDYVSPDPKDNGRIFHAPDREPTLDAAVAPLLNGVLGLSNAAVPHNDLRRVSVAHLALKSAARANASQASSATANVAAGTVYGNVYDLNDNPLTSGTVQLVNTNTSASSPAAVSVTSSGGFQFNSVPAGTYTLVAYNANYNSSETLNDATQRPVSTITVRSGTSLDLDVKLFIDLDPNETRSLYGLASSEQTDSGQNQILGLVEFDTFVQSDITHWEQEYNLTSAYPAITPVSVDGTVTTSAPTYQDDADEAELDIDMLLSLACNAKQIRVYEGSTSEANGTDAQFSNAFVDVFDAMANDSTPASVISCSWGQSENEITQAESQSETVALEQLALQGQTFCNASGDDGAYDDGTSSHVNVGDPGSQPTVVCVGGTDLAATFTRSNDTAAITSQTSWWEPNPPADQPPIGYGGGGGISMYQSIPSWQKGAFSASVNPQGSTTMRNTPDVSLYASDDAGYNIYVAAEGGDEPVAGTSAAAPLWAAMIADANVKCLAAGKAVLGEATPEIYALAESSSYSTDFYDIADDSNNGYYNAVQGYDNSTGWGTPKNGSQMISDLAAGTSSTTTADEARFDFNKDGHADLIWYNTGSGAISVWDMNDTTVLQYGSAFAEVAPSSGWVPVAAPDVNNDDYPDLLWWNKNTGALSFWTLSNTNVLSYGNTFATVADTNWKPVAAADVTGTTWELVFQNSATGAVSVWQMNGEAVTSYGGTLTSLGSGSPWQIVGAPDLNGDGNSDLLLWNSSTGEVSWWECNLKTPQVIAYNGDIAKVADTTWHLIGSEDTNGDGHPDLIWWNASSGAESRWLMNGTTVEQYGGTTAQVQDTTWQPTAIR